MQLKDKLWPPFNSTKRVGDFMLYQGSPIGKGSFGQVVLARHDPINARDKNAHYQMDHDPTDQEDEIGLVACKIITIHNKP